MGNKTKIFIGDEDKDFNRVILASEKNLPQGRSLAPDEEQGHGSGKRGKERQAGGHSSPPAFLVIRHRGP